MIFSQQWNREIQCSHMWRVSEQAVPDVSKSPVLSVTQLHTGKSIRSESLNKLIFELCINSVHFIMIYSRGC
jgi:hypothetical protein